MYSANVAPKIYFQLSNYFLQLIKMPKLIKFLSQKGVLPETKREFLKILWFSELAEFSIKVDPFGGKRIPLVFGSFRVYLPPPFWRGNAPKKLCGKLKSHHRVLFC